MNSPHETATACATARKGIVPAIDAASFVCTDIEVTLENLVKSLEPILRPEPPMSPSPLNKDGQINPMSAQYQQVLALNDRMQRISDSIYRVLSRVDL